jgi:UDP-N-acetylglucosamine 1-carboxyvinyltransferase
MRLATLGAHGEIHHPGRRSALGKIVPAGNKNAALPILAACLLTEEELVVRNVPRIRDVESMLGLLERLGVKVAWTGDNEVKLQADSISGTEVDEELANRIRASFLVAGPLLARFGEVKMPPRAVTRSDAAAWMPIWTPSAIWGQRWTVTSGLSFRRRRPAEGDAHLHGRALRHGHRERAPGRGPDRGPTTIVNAACEPHVQDLARLLCKMGAEIDGIGSNVMNVRGQKKLGARSTPSVRTTSRSRASWPSLPRRAASSGSGDHPEDLEGIRRHFRRIGSRRWRRLGT